MEFNPFKLAENRAEQKDVKKQIEKIVNDFNFHINEIQEKGGLGRRSNRYGDFLEGLTEEKFIIIHQMANLLKSRIEELSSQQDTISADINKQLDELKTTCEHILAIAWEPYPKDQEDRKIMEAKFGRVPNPPTLSNKTNTTMSALLSDIYRPIHTLKTVDFPSIFSSKVDIGQDHK